MDMYSSFWENEFADLELYDARISKRLVSLMSSMSSKPGATCNGMTSEKKKTKAAYRLIDNPSLDIDEILHIHFEKLVERIGTRNQIYLIEDTSGFNYSHAGVKGIGSIGGKLTPDKSESRGLFAHTTLALSDRGEPLGIFDQQIWARKKPKFSKSELSSIPLNMKSSFRWIKALDREEYLSGSNTKFILLADREADFCAFQGTLIDRSIDFVIRVRDNRHDVTSGKNLAELFESMSERKTIKLDVEKRSIEQKSYRKQIYTKYKKEDQETEFELKYAEVVLKVESVDEIARTEKLFAVQINETRKKPGKKKISWTLLTTLPVQSYEEAIEIIHHYKVRWRIEVFHKTQKSVCQIENAKFRTGDRLKNYLFLQSLVAFAVFRLKYLLMSATEEPAANYFEPSLIEILIKNASTYKAAKIVTVKDFVFMLANIEGYKTFKLESPPGIIVLGKAINSFNLILHGYDMALK